MSKNDFCPYCKLCLCNENGGVLNEQDGLYYHKDCLEKKLASQEKTQDPNMATVTDKKT